MLRDNAGWFLAGLIAAAVLLGAGACGGDGSPTYEATGGSISFRQATPTPPSPTRAPTRPVVSSRLWGAGPSIAVGGRTTIYLPSDISVHMLLTECPPVGLHLPCPDERMFHIVERGDSYVWIGVGSGKIVKWEVAPEDEEEFRRLIREPLEEAGY